MSLGASPRVLAAALAAAAGGFAYETRAQEPARQISETRVSFDIPAQPLSSALSEFARQSGVRVLFAYDNLNGARAPALRGAFTREEALVRLLAGSEFAGHIDGDGVVRLEQRPRPQPIGAEAPQQTTHEPQPSNAQPSRDAAGDNADTEVIVVTGTRIRGAPPAGSLVIELDAEAIEQTGRGTVQEVLQTLPQNFAGSQNEFTQEGAQNARQNFSYASTVDLRGLGADATLILVDGHRLAPAGQGGYIDISTIPLSAIERVEVLADGASAAYGA